MNSPKLANSPVGPKRYNRSKRLTFLFAALRTRSLMARDELAEIATGGACDSNLLIGVLGSQVEIVNRRALLDLAWLLSNQQLFEHDLQNARRIYDYALEVYGLGKFTQMHKVNLAILALKLGDQPMAERAVAKVPAVFGLASKFFPGQMQSIRMQALTELGNSFFMLNRDYTVSSEFLRIDAANPFRGLSMNDAVALCKTPAAAEWLKRLNKQVFGPLVAPMAFVSNPSSSPLDSLTVADGQATPGSCKLTGPKVTVVMSTFQPNIHVYAAVNSTLAQTYGNLELLVIDDCSGEEYDEILNHIATMDPRVRVLRQTVNGGTYRIRNRALDEATGELITFQDSDDWMHPQRLELQVSDLVSNPDIVSNVSMSTRLTERLEAVESNRRLRIGICEPSLMFWRDKVKAKIGYFDGVRKGGDTEYRKRIYKAFNQDGHAVVPWRILTIQRADNGGLTQGELGFRWITEFRTNYRDSYLHWQNRIAKKENNWYIERDGQRKFFAPRYVTMLGAEARAERQFDVVIAANLRDSPNMHQALKLATEAIDAGKTVAFLQLNNIYPRTLWRSFGGQILDLLNAGGATMVYSGDTIVAGHLQLIAPSAWLMSYARDTFAWSIGGVSVTSLADSTEQWKPQGANITAELSHTVAEAFGLPQN